MNLLSNEEVVLIERIGRDKVLYSPAAQVLHVINQERLTQKWFRRRAYWQAVSDQIADLNWLSLDRAWEEYSTFIARSPAERRSMLALFDDCNDGKRLAHQLRAIYALAILASSGLVISHDSTEIRK
jgi:hypothetical protein